MKPSRPYLITTEILYLVVFAISAVEVVLRWETERQRAYIFIVFAVGAVFMFFFRRRMRRKMAAHWKSNSDATQAND